MSRPGTKSLLPSALANVTDCWTTWGCIHGGNLLTYGGGALLQTHSCSFRFFASGHSLGNLGESRRMLYLHSRVGLGSVGDHTSRPHLD